MDRRVLVAVAVGAALFAVALGVLFAPDTGTPPSSAPSVAAGSGVVAPRTPMATGPAVARRSPARPSGVGTPAATAPDYIPPRAVASGASVVPPAKAAPPVEPSPEYRCRALGQQAELIDKLVVIGSGGAIDDTQRVEMVGRVAQLSVRVFEEGESLWSGALSCDGISHVNLGAAADYLGRMQDELELEGTAADEVDQALKLLGTVSWSELERASGDPD